MAAKVNLIIDQGASFTTEITVLDENNNPIDFSSYTANSQMRKTFSSNTAYTFTVTGSNAGILTLSMNAATTSSISAGRYVYDVEVQTGSDRSRIVEGLINVTPEVTR